MSPTGKLWRLAGRAQRGFSIVELMVAMAIGLLLTAVIASVMTVSENDRRGNMAVNDVNQSGGFAAYALDRQLRSAGSGFASAWPAAIGCVLTAQNAAGQVLPRSPAFTASSPFATWSTNGLPLRLAPVIIGKDMADTATQTRGDIIVAMSGAAGFGESGSQLLPGITYTGGRLRNTLGFRTGDLVLLADPAIPAGCMVQQVQFSSGAGGASQTLPFGGGYNVGVVNGVDVASFGSTSTVMQLGNITANAPQFAMLAVGDNFTLYSNDLLPPIAPDDIGTPIADDVAEMHALYGLSGYPTAATANVVSWADPGSNGYTAQALTAGTMAAQTALHTIVSVRVGLVLRTSVAEQKPMYSTDPSSPTKLTLFADVTDAGGASLARQVSLPTTAPYYRYRVMELTVPLRNVMYAP